MPMPEPREIGTDLDYVCTAADRLAALEAVCAQVYQAAGAYDMPERVLDILSDGANGDPIRHADILPVDEPDHLQRIAALEAENGRLLQANKDCVAWFEDARAEAEQWQAMAEGHQQLGDELREKLGRVEALAEKWRAAPQNPDEPLLAMAADDLAAALSASEPAAVKDSVTTEPAASGAGELPIMARSTFNALMDRDGLDPHNDANLLDAGEIGIGGRHFRIVDTDEHGLPVVPREAWMPAEAKYRSRLIEPDFEGEWIYWPRLLPARSDGETWQRIEDFNGGCVGEESAS